MKTNYILVDYENVQPEILDSINQDHFRLFVFVGENQAKLPFEFVSAIQKLGEKAQYIKINGNGKNALDFHIAFYIGELAKEDSNAYFHIISKDSGFDPLISHLKCKKIFCSRSKDIRSIPLIKLLDSESLSERLDAVIDNLRLRGNSRPRKEKTLSSSINSLFQNKLSPQGLKEFIVALQDRKVIAINNGNISYEFPE